MQDIIDTLKRAAASTQKALEALERGDAEAATEPLTHASCATESALAAVTAAVDDLGHVDNLGPIENSARWEASLLSCGFRGCTNMATGHGLCAPCREGMIG